MRSFRERMSTSEHTFRWEQFFAESVLDAQHVTAIGQDQEFQGFSGNVVAREGLEPPTPGL